MDGIFITAEVDALSDCQLFDLIVDNVRQSLNMELIFKILNDGVKNSNE